MNRTPPVKEDANVAVILTAAEEAARLTDDGIAKLKEARLRLLPRHQGSASSSPSSTAKTEAAHCSSHDKEEDVRVGEEATADNAVQNPKKAHLTAEGVAHEDGHARSSGSDAAAERVAGDGDVAKGQPQQRSTSASSSSSSSSFASSTDISSLNSLELEEDFTAGIAEQVADEQGMALTEEYYSSNPVLARVTIKKRLKREQMERRLGRYRASASMAAGGSALLGDADGRVPRR